MRARGIEIAHGELQTLLMALAIALACGCSPAPSSFEAKAAGLVDQVIASDHHSIFTGRNCAPPQFIRSFGTSGGGNLQFATPHGVALHPSNLLVVADTFNQRMQVLTRSGRYIRQWATGAGSGPRGVNTDGDGNIYVTRSTAATELIRKYDITGRQLAAWGALGGGAAELNTPYGIWFYDATLYVADVRNDRIQKYSPTGVHRGSIGNGQGQADGEFLHPHGVGVYDDEIYVVDTHNSRVQVFAMNGTFRRKWGSSAAGDMQLTEPYGVAFDIFGDVYISEHGGGRIKKFSSDGSYQLRFGRPGTGDGQLLAPRFMAIDECTIYVVDGGDRVNEWGPCSQACTQYQLCDPTSGDCVAAPMCDLGAEDGTRCYRYTGQTASEATGYTCQHGDMEDILQCLPNPTI